MKVLDSDEECKVVNMNKNSDLWNDNKTSKKFNDPGYKTIKIELGGETQILYKRRLRHFSVQMKNLYHLQKQVIISHHTSLLAINLCYLQI